MTSEVVLMNRQAVALAADSATTVKYWTGKHYENRFFKGANKIFHLSNHYPIGMMIYGTADLQSVSWEVIGKSFRDHLGDKQHNTVSDYATAFFDFIENSPRIFPADYQKRWFLEKAERAAVTIIASIIFDDDFKSAKKAADKKRIMSKEFDDNLKYLKEGPFVPGATQEVIDVAVKEHADEVKESLFKEDIVKDHAKFFDANQLGVAGVLGVYHEKMPGLDSTGLVFAGFGADEYFPATEVYNCQGLILGKCMCGPKHESLRVDHDSGSFVEPMAQSDMIQTFVDGVGLGALNTIEKELFRAMDNFADECMKENKIKKWADLEDAKEKARTNFREAVFDYMFYHHSVPMRRVVGMLPINELADLAETLIYMESLKERVTAPSESISGPIDVAVISKNDGFVWIKRKHYFEANLNPRYFASHGLT